MTDAEYRAEIAKLKAQLNESQTKRLTLKVSAKGAASLYGLGKFPVTLYVQQWERIIAFVPEIQAFLTENVDKLATKPKTGDVASEPVAA